MIIAIAREGFVIENTVSLLPGWRSGFYGTSSGAEIDLILEKGRKRVEVFPMKKNVKVAPLYNFLKIYVNNY